MGNDEVSWPRKGIHEITEMGSGVSAEGHAMER